MNNDDLIKRGVNRGQSAQTTLAKLTPRSFTFIVLISAIFSCLPSCVEDSKVKLSNEIKNSLFDSITLAKTDNDNIDLRKALNFNDFDRACILLPYSSETEVSKDLGFSYRPTITNDDNYWGLLLIKENMVIAEIEIDRLVVDYPSELSQKCMGKDSTFVVAKNNNGKYFINFIRLGN